jgi:hypothetical protein
VLRRTFGPNRDELTGGWRKLLNEELHICTLRQVLLDKVEEDEMGRASSTNGGEEERVLVIGEKTRGKETTRKTKA